MISLTFGEQVKIVLSRKGMTIKELAEEIEERTGKKMSRQNLTQRLGRDNFQEQDMRMIADILGCSFQLSILSSADEEKISEAETSLPTGSELEKLAAKKEKKAAREEAKKAVERDITVGEFVDMLEETEELEKDGTEEVEDIDEPIVSVADDVTEVDEEEAEDISDEVELDAEEAEAYTEAEELPEETVDLEDAVEGAEEQQAEAEAVPESAEEMELPVEEAEVTGETEAEDVQPEAAGEPVAENQPEEPVSEEYAAENLVQEAEPYVEASPVEEEPVQPVEEKKESTFSKITHMVTSSKKEKKSTGWPQDFQPIRKRRDDIDEDLVNGDVNPYTGHEYQTNSVRMHPHRIGYVQVYDRKDHKWTDMTEWAFLGVEERKKAALGKDYEPPIYLD